MGQARHLFRPRRAGLFRDHPKGPRRHQDPTDYLQLTEAKTVAPAEVEDAFVKVNPGLSTSAIAVTCNGNRLSEVRICLGKDCNSEAARKSIAAPAPAIR